MKHMITLLAIFGLLAAGIARAQSAEEIVRRMEKNQVHDTAEYEGRMIITDRFGSRVKTYKAYGAGTNEMLIEFTNPEEQGQKILRLANEIYLYFPDAEEIIHLQGSALKDSVLGSDFSYEDMTGEKGLLDLYTVRLQGTEELEGKSYYRLELKGKERGVAYPRQELWVDGELMVFKKALYYSLSGRLLKEMEIEEVKRVAGKNVPVHMVMQDAMKKNSRTEFLVDEIRINQPLPANIFSLEELSW